MKNWWLYTLKLEHGKYYVCITSQTPEVRMQEHIKGIRGAYWTKEHVPLQVIDKEKLGFITEEKAKEIENKKVRDCMKVYGLNNVRGGDLTKNIEITQTGEYAKFFGYIYMKKDIDMLKIVLLLLIVLAFMTVFLLSN